MQEMMLVAGMALVVEKLVERIKEKIPGVRSWMTSLVALLLSAALVMGVSQLRVLSLFFEQVEDWADVLFSSLIIAAGSGFIATIEDFLRPSKPMEIQITDSAS